MKHKKPLRAPSPVGIDLRKCKTRYDFCKFTRYWVSCYDINCKACLFGYENRGKFNKWFKKLEVRV